ncbi:hypothetical protein QBC40DRAFT_79029 [Triangularia verruculosa]|uniref:Uncharacterized protein n=1 Tax=Triangularia verruculosa TaxID=2587418 RepID=A0AAN7AUD6_9PEZI|nr:hypothetical protein QBC40DRAFT_79029 [Triangularia verruculosa]
MLEPHSGVTNDHSFFVSFFIISSHFILGIFYYFSAIFFDISSLYQQSERGQSMDTMAHIYTSDCNGGKISQSSILLGGEGFSLLFSVLFFFSSLFSHQ